MLIFRGVADGNPPKLLKESEILLGIRFESEARCTRKCRSFHTMGHYDRYNWNYNPYKWPYKWVTVVITPTYIIGVTGP